MHTYEPRAPGPMPPDPPMPWPDLPSCPGAAAAMTTVTVEVRVMGNLGEGHADMTTTVNHDRGITVQVTAEHKNTSCRCIKRARAMTTVTVQVPEGRKAKATTPTASAMRPGDRPPRPTTSHGPAPNGSIEGLDVSVGAGPAPPRRRPALIRAPPFRRRQRRRCVVP